MRERRTVIAGAVGVVAAAAGLGLAWWQQPPDALEVGDAGDAEVQRKFWASIFASPSGAPLAMQSLRGKPLLLNFWATWCPPCIEEFPLIDGFFKKNAANGWQVLGLAIDKPASVQEFLRKMPVSFPVVVTDSAGTELGRDLGNLTGGLPFSVAFGASGQVLQRKMGKLTQADLNAWTVLY